MLRNLPRQRLAVGGGHPVIRLDALLGVDARLELRRPRDVLYVPILGF